MKLPPATRRLFPSHRAEDLLRGTGRGLLVGRLLEEGDRRDLAWLTAEIGEQTLADWVERRGRRQLSRRSLAFWSRLLDTPRAEPPDDPLWPL